MGDVFIVHWHLPSCLFLHLHHLDKLKQPRNLLTPTQDSFCLVQIKEERPGPTVVARAWISREYLGARSSVVPPSVAVHGQRCVLHHIIHR